MFRQALGPTQFPIQWVPSFFTEGKSAGAGSKPLTAEVMNG